LLSVGLLDSIGDYFELPKGYYRIECIFLLLAFMTLARLQSIETLRYRAPGEWGKNYWVWIVSPKLERYVKKYAT